MPKSIADLRRDRKAAADKMKTASDKLGGLEEANAAADSAEVTAATAEFASAEAEYKAVSETLARAEAVEAAQAAAAVGDQGAGGQPANPGANLPAAAADPALKGVSVGFMVQALARNKGDRDKAMADLEGQGHSGLSAALSGATESAGGVTIPRPQAEELIQLLRPRVVIRGSGARTFPMPAGQIRHAKQIASATATYTGENAPISPSEPEFDKLDQSFKKLTSLVPIGNSLLRHSGVAMATVVRDDVLAVMALREDLAFLRNDGSGNLPKGLRSWILPANWLASVSATVAAAETALRTVVSRVEDANVGMVSPGWIMRASAKNWLASLRDPLGFVLFPSITTSNSLLGYPIRTTSQVPNNLGTETDETEIYFGDFNEAMIGDSMVLTVGSSTEAGYVDASDNFVSAFQNDLTLVRAISEHDFATARDEAFAGFNGIGWSL